jgi:hypothetical protein
VSVELNGRKKLNALLRLAKSLSACVLMDMVI